ncbi:hypothetical protein BD560DRAFT_420554 [Blakeslea trispora]|nr:hypothetical protein BD560DRAFT_420554 [Blakeslea trispora]
MKVRIMKLQSANLKRESQSKCLARLSEAIKRIFKSQCKASLLEGLSCTKTIHPFQRETNQQLKTGNYDNPKGIIYDIALDNFCLLVYKITEIEYFDYSVFPPRRINYTLCAKSNKWKTQAANP